jgi:hypothetical protein
VRTKWFGLLICVFALGVPSSAQALDVRYLPDPLYTNASTITINWDADRNLNPKYHYVGYLSIQLPPAGRECDVWESAETHHSVSKGKTVYLHFELDIQDEEWCNGIATIRLGYQSNNNHSERETPEHQIFKGQFRIRRLFP